MNGWDIASGIINIIARLPVERLFRTRSNRDIEQLENRLKEKGLLSDLKSSPSLSFNPTVKQPESQNKASSEQETIIITQAPEKSLEISSTPQDSQEKAGHTIGTACVICNKHHIITSSGALGEGLRFARSEGMDSPEVKKRLEIAVEEIDIAERIDFAPSEVERASEEEKRFLSGFLPKVRDYRHKQDLISTVDDLQRVAALGQELATEYRTKQRELTPPNMLELVELSEKVKKGEITLEEVKERGKELRGGS